MRPMGPYCESGATGIIDARDGRGPTRGDFERLTVYVFRSCVFWRKAIWNSTYAYRKLRPI